MEKLTQTCLASCVFLSWALPVAGQQTQQTAQTQKTGNRQPWYIGMTVGAVTRPAGPTDYHYAPPMLGGTTPAIVVTGGVALMPHVTVGGEVSVASALSGVLVFNHFLHFSDLVSYRETFASAFLSVHASAGAVTVEPLLAFGLALGSTSYTQHVDYRDGASSPDQFYHAVYTGLGPGLNLAVRCSPHVAVTVSGRLYFVWRNQTGGELSYTGLGNRTYFVGAGIRLTPG